jgi:hypothetical protein
MWSFEATQASDAELAARSRAREASHIPVPTRFVDIFVNNETGEKVSTIIESSNLDTKLERAASPIDALDGDEDTVSDVNWVDIPMKTMSPEECHAAYVKDALDQTTRALENLSYGNRILRVYGWVPGQSLNPNGHNKGILAPIPAINRESTAGLGTSIEMPTWQIGLEYHLQHPISERQQDLAHEKGPDEPYPKGPFIRFINDEGIIIEHVHKHLVVMSQSQGTTSKGLFGSGYVYGNAIEKLKTAEKLAQEASNDVTFARYGLKSVQSWYDAKQEAVMNSKYPTARLLSEAKQAKSDLENSRATLDAAEETLKEARHTVIAVGGSIQHLPVSELQSQGMASSNRHVHLLSTPASSLSVSERAEQTEIRRQKKAEDRALMRDVANNVQVDLTKSSKGRRNLERARLQAAWKEEQERLSRENKAPDAS